MLFGRLPYEIHYYKDAASATLETTKGQIDGRFSQPAFKYYLPEVASVGNSLNICTWVALQSG